MEQALFIASIAMIPREADATRPREILDFTKLNKYILDADCRLPSRGDLVSLVNNYSFAASVDIKSCYTNIKLHPDYQTYCCISWRKKVYKFTRVPFGIKCAPACCQTVTSFLSKESTVVYLDDFLLFSNSEEDLAQRLQDQVLTLERNGLPINASKSVLVPQQEIAFCGYLLRFGENKGVFTTDKHLKDLSLYVKLLSTKESIDLITWRSFVGKYNWCRARQEDERVHAKLVALMNECDSSTNHIVLDHVARAMLDNMVAQCSLPFNY